MNIKSLNITKHHLYPIVVLDHILSHRTRHSVGRFLDVSIVILFFATIVSYGLKFIPFIDALYIEQATMIAPKIMGLLLVLISILLFIIILELFFRFSYFEEHETTNEPTFDVLKILYTATDGDLTKSFIQSAAGEKILLRCGIPTTALQTEFLAKRSGILFDAPFPEITDGPFTLSSLVLFLLSVDEEFRTFIVRGGIREPDLVGCAEWVMRQNALAKKQERWWSHERLAAIPGIGKDWAYGAAFTLARYGKEIVERYDTYASTMSLKDTAEVTSLERILARSTGADAIIVGLSEAASMDVVFNFARSIARGIVTPELEGKKIFVLDYNLIVAALHTKDEYETTMITIFEEAINAGNIILVISNLPAFLAHARSLNSDVVTLVEPYLSSGRLQAIATIDMDNFHNVVEQNAVLMSQFEKVVVTEPSEAKMVPILERVAENLESRNPVFFLYSAIDEALRSAENYLPDGVLPDKAVSLLIEVVPQCMQAHKVIVDRSDILTLIKTKTNIPVGEIQTAEREKLLSLEQFLRERVVGQDEAIKVTANALRRARAGVRNMKRPIGSALFLGPTGVGKTETVKALADLFFGDEKAILRFDMSEYQTADSLERLIGFSEGERAGTLTKALKERPYGVLLLDEFEKANKEILDLFLQVLDEGFFSDMRGKRVSARNVIIVATSNAGSEFIWEAREQGLEVSTMKDKILSKIIERGVYRPELLNRFDAVVLFNPLGEKELAQIARIMLQKLQKRLKEKNLELVITDDLVNAVIKHGTDPLFGARPMNRAIQEKVEQAIAEKLIRGEIGEGSQVVILPEELI
ncbi:MAG: hypothetical protein A2481_02575 [Candidatus Yonathbacteria bacterium RIFOXYC2_FULL_47_9]|nr:MAG: hypothetical protein A2481_02575 [Candidatus Yonathbacteria bacterium RIFOXYC2_FULL_47_9]